MNTRREGRARGRAERQARAWQESWGRRPRSVCIKGWLRPSRDEFHVMPAEHRPAALLPRHPHGQPALPRARPPPRRRPPARAPAAGRRAAAACRAGGRCPGSAAARRRRRPQGPQPGARRGPRGGARRPRAARAGRPAAGGGGAGGKRVLGRRFSSVCTAQQALASTWQATQAAARSWHGVCWIGGRRTFDQPACACTHAPRRWRSPLPQNAPPAGAVGGRPAGAAARPRSGPAAAAGRGWQAGQSTERSARHSGRLGERAVTCTAASCWWSH